MRWGAMCRRRGPSEWDFRAAASLTWLAYRSQNEQSLAWYGIPSVGWVVQATVAVVDDVPARCFPLSEEWE